MDPSSRSDLLILAAALGGVAAALAIRASRQPTAAGDTAPAAAVLPALLAAVTIARRGGQAMGWYPQNGLGLGLGAFGIGLGVGLLPPRVSGFLPRAA